jgi:hypothetical protein
VSEMGLLPSSRVSEMGLPPSSRVSEMGLLREMWRRVRLTGRRSVVTRY